MAANLGSKYHGNGEQGFGDVELEVALEESRKSYLAEEAQRRLQPHRNGRMESAGASEIAAGSNKSPPLRMGKTLEQEEVDLMCMEDPLVKERERQIDEIKRLFLVEPPAPSPATSPPAMAYCTWRQPTSQIHRELQKFENQPPLLTHHSASTPSFCNPFESRPPMPPIPHTALPSESSQAPHPLLTAEFKNGGDLMQLELPQPAPSKRKSLSIDDFDPLCQIKEPLSTASGDNMNSAAAADKTSLTKNGQLHSRSSSEPFLEPNSATIKKDPETKTSAKASIARNKNRSICVRQMTCEDLVVDDAPSSHREEIQSLMNEAAKLGETIRGSDVYFLAPTTDYFTVAEEQTIKLAIYQDDSWRKDLPTERQRYDIVAGCSATAQEVLQNLLVGRQLIPRSELDRTGGLLPTTEYALKIRGHDELLGADVVIGRLPYVERCLSLGRDVELEIGLQKYHPSPPPTDAVMGRFRQELLKLTGQQATTSQMIDREHIGIFLTKLKTHVAECMASSHESSLRQTVAQLVLMMTTYTNNVQPGDLISAVGSFVNAQSEEQLKEGVHLLVSALHRLLSMYSRSALHVDFSLPPNLDMQLVGKSEGENERTVQESSSCEGILMLSVESMHNLPREWQNCYSGYRIEAHLMYGPKSYGMRTSGVNHVVNDEKGSKARHQPYVPFTHWFEFDIALASLPRECQVCFIIRANPQTPNATALGEESHVAGSSSGTLSTLTEQMLQSPQQIATANLPLFNRAGLLQQGGVLLPLTLMVNSDILPRPWGPRPLLGSRQEPVLLVKCLEYDFDVQFPKELPPCDSDGEWREFANLPEEERNLLEEIVEEGRASHMLSEDDKLFLWANRKSLRHLPKALPMVLAASFSWGPYQLAKIYALLAKWVELPAPTAIELLLPDFPDRVVREWAINHCIRKSASTEFLLSFLPQFIEALRYEPCEDSALALFLLEQCTKERRFAMELYWQLHQRVVECKGVNLAYASRCANLKQALLNELRIPHLAEELARQHQLLKRLDKLANDVKSSGNPATTLKNQLYQLSEEVDFRHIRFPVNPAFRCKALVVEECGHFNSLTRPIRLIVEGRSAGGPTYGVIYKAGDDLRQDAIVLQLVQVMRTIWQRHGLDLRMTTFRCMPTRVKKGLIELVPDCKTLREIQTAAGAGATGVFRDELLNAWLLRENPSEFDYKAALMNFRRSCAGWCVATYVLGIADRHNDNILVSTKGQVFHIDFGKYMGDWQLAAGGFKRDRVPFILTPEMAYVINAGSQQSTEHFQLFIDDCCRAFNLLRQHCSLLINIIRFMSSSDIPGMNADSVAFVASNLMLELDDFRASMLFTRMIEDSMKSRFPRWNFFAHTVAQFKANPLLISGVMGKSSEEMNRLSFNSETFDEKSEGRIQAVDVAACEKWHMPDKVYMYRLVVRREKQSAQQTIYRSYAEFQELRWKLCYRFSRRAMPSLGTGVSIVGRGQIRTNVRVVAEQRIAELRLFLGRLFHHEGEVAHSDLVYTFFRSIYRDYEPNAVRQGLPREPILSSYPSQPSDMAALPSSSSQISASAPQIHLRIAWDPSAGELRLFVGHAKNLPLVAKEQPPDSYVKTYLRPRYHNLTSKVWKRKSAVVRRNQTPTYNTELVYSLSSWQSNEMSGEVMVGLSGASDIATMAIDLSVWQSGPTNYKLCEMTISLAGFHPTHSNTLSDNALNDATFTSGALMPGFGVQRSPPAASSGVTDVIIRDRRGVRVLEKWYTLDLANHT